MTNKNISLIMFIRNVHQECSSEMLMNKINIVILGTSIIDIINR